MSYKSWKCRLDWIGYQQKCTRFQHRFRWYLHVCRAFIWYAFVPALVMSNCRAQSYAAVLEAILNMTRIVQGFKMFLFCIVFHPLHCAVTVYYEWYVIPHTTVFKHMQARKTVRTTKWNRNNVSKLFQTLVLKLMFQFNFVLRTVASDVTRRNSLYFQRGGGIVVASLSPRALIGFCRASEIFRWNETCRTSWRTSMDAVAPRSVVWSLRKQESLTKTWEWKVRSGLNWSPVSVKRTKHVCSFVS